MGSWDKEIFAREENIDFLDELIDLEDEEIVEAIHDACLLARDNERASEEELSNGLAAATVAAIWSGAQYSAVETVEAYPFIRDLAGSAGESLREVASEVLEEADTEEDLEVYLEALT